MKRNLLLLLFLQIILSTIVYANKIGNATYYSHKLHGRHTSDGGKYHRDSMTCAHLTYPFGTILKVRNPKNDREVIVKVTDRGPHNKRFIIDLSYCAAKELDIVRAGIAKVEIMRLESMPPRYPILSSLHVPVQGIKIEKINLRNLEFPGRFLMAD